MSARIGQRATKSLRSTFQKHFLGGYTINIPRRTASICRVIPFYRMIPCCILHICLLVKFNRCSIICVTVEPLSSEQMAPKFTTELVTQEVLIGQPVTMSCDVIGTPAPDVTWYQVSSCRARFLPRDAMLARVFAVVVCLSVCTWRRAETKEIYH